METGLVGRCRNTITEKIAMMTNTITYKTIIIGPTGEHSRPAMGAGQDDVPGQAEGRLLTPW